jgi:hypothetical protein
MKAMAGVAMLAVSYYVLAPVVTMYRQVAIERGLGWGVDTTVGGVVGVLDETLERVRSDEEVIYDETGQAKVVERVTYPAMLNEVLFYFGAGGLPLMGSSYAVALIAGIPRVLWSGKPDVAMGRYFGQMFGGNAITSYAISMLGELYINFALPGIVLGMLIFGVLYRVLWNSAFASMEGGGTLSRVIYLVVWMQLLVLGTGDNFAVVVSGVVKTMLIVTGMLVLVGVKPPWLRGRRHFGGLRRVLPSGARALRTRGSVRKRGPRLV